MPSPNGAFHVIIGGKCQLEVDNVPGPVELASGDLILMLRGPGHVLRDSSASPVRPVWEMLPPERLRRHEGIFGGGGGTVTTIVHGVFLCENQSGSRLLSALPPVLHLKAQEGRLSEWLESITQLLNVETSQHEPGAQAIINHLTQILFIRALRNHMRSPAAGQGNWLTAVLDPEIGVALGFIHYAPELPWTVASLADAVAISRSAFAARFSALVGEPPLQYLTGYRMQRAAEMLREGRLPIKEVAAKVGYESEAAFGKAFKRAMGMAPGYYRDHAPRTVPSAANALSR